MWVRDYRPNAVHKWIRAVIKSVDGPLSYSVLLDNGHSRRVHVDHIIVRLELSTSSSMATTASRSPGELADMVVQNIPPEGSDSPVMAPLTCPVDTAAATSGALLTPSQQESVHGDPHFFAAITTDNGSPLGVTPSSLPQTHTTEESTQPSGTRRSSRSITAPM